MPAESTEVLIVDDSPTDAELTMHALRRDSASPAVTWLLNGEDVDRHFAQLGMPRGRIQLPDLVLMEVDLPGTNGLRILKRLKSDSRTHVVPVVMFTSRTDEAIVRQCYDLGANSYIVKPSSALEYLHTIGSVTRYWLSVNHRFDAGITAMLARRDKKRDGTPDTPPSLETSR